MKSPYKTLLTASILSLVFFLPVGVFAQSTPTAVGSTPTAVGSTPTGLTNPLQATSLTGLISEIISYAVQIGTIFLTLMLIYVGFQFVAARGNEEKLQSARSALLWTVIGGLILLGASAIANAIASTVSSL